MELSRQVDDVMKTETSTTVGGFLIECRAHTKRRSLEVIAKFFHSFDEW